MHGARGHLRSLLKCLYSGSAGVDQTAPSNLPLVFDDDRCLFNTGLYTRRYETIYGLFEPNTRPDARQRWFLKGFFQGKRTYAGLV